MSPEPRDRSEPPPGWAWYEHTVDGAVVREGYCVPHRYEAHLAEAWSLFDEWHLGMEGRTAPDPELTEAWGPWSLHEDFPDVLCGGPSHEVRVEGGVVVFVHPGAREYGCTANVHAGALIALLRRAGLLGEDTGQ